MPSPDSTLDPKSLQARVAELESVLSSKELQLKDQAQKLKDREALIYNKEEQVQKLLQQISQLQNHQFGARSERLLNPNQLEWDFFNEAELLAALDALAEQKKANVKSHKRRGRKSKPLPLDLPRVDVPHEPDNTQCHDCGEQMTRIGEDVSEQLAIVPQVFYVIRHIRGRYACKCKQSARTAPKPKQPLAGTIASAVLLAYILVAKYLDGLPLYRQEKMAARAGIELPRNKMARWVVDCGLSLKPIYDLLEQSIWDYDITLADETGIQVLKEPDRAAQSKSWLWIRRGGPPGKEVVLVDYSPSRSSKVATELFRDFSGYLVCDAYSGYLPLRTDGKAVLVYCNDHARRRFTNVVKAVGKDHSVNNIIATRGAAWYRCLYAVEESIKEQAPENKYQVRQEKAVPLWNEFMKWTKKLLEQGVQHQGTREALQYLANHEVQLRRYCEDGRLPISNIKSEHVAKTIAVPRKNFLFADTQAGAKASAMSYSIIETAKVHRHNPHKYLTVLLTELPNATQASDYEKLLPWNLSSETVDELFKSYPTL